MIKKTRKRLIKKIRQRWSKITRDYYHKGLSIKAIARKYKKSTYSITYILRRDSKIKFVCNQSFQEITPFSEHEDDYGGPLGKLPRLYND